MEEWSFKEVEDAYFKGMFTPVGKVFAEKLPYQPVRVELTCRFHHVLSTPAD